MAISVDPTAFQNASVGTVLGEDPDLNELKTEDFFKLLITQLTQQDPFEPVKNQDLLNQVSSIRDMEMNTNLNATLEKLAAQGEENTAASFLLTQTLQALAMQSDMATGASLIGKQITALVLPAGASPNDPTVEAAEVTGVVLSVKLVDGDVKLELDSGDEVFLMDVSEVTMPSDGAAVADDSETADDDQSA